MQKTFQLSAHRQSDFGSCIASNFHTFYVITGISNSAIMWGWFSLLLISSVLTTCGVQGAGRGTNGGGLKIVSAVNAGGDSHTDIYGVTYQKDPATQGVASDHGMRMSIDRAHPNDEILYQTERYSPSTFGYDIPVKEDGKYVLVLKFSEVYFRGPNQKIFDVVLNSRHKIVSDLDIFGNVGYATAHDEIIPFEVLYNGKTLLVGSHSSDIRKEKIRLDFVKGSADNPKINAFYVAKASIEDIPTLPPPRGVEEEKYLYSEDDEDVQFSQSDLGYEGMAPRLPIAAPAYSSGKIDVRSGPVSDNPWDYESPLTTYLPLFGAAGAFVVSYFVVRFANSL
ncbi:Malectin [Orchesella cincta]|uniref:Malectin n=1 Tax=Orchesella cincta TaxID=48709 RepID=A0A1D2MR74_ORCCI|nr:Malectin [Orchesella cincta]